MRNHPKDWLYYTYVHSESHKHFSTKQEKSAYCIHMIEYKQYKLKIRPSRGSNIQCRLY